MQDSPHSLLVGNSATKFAKKIGFPILTDPLELISEESRLQLKGIKFYFLPGKKGRKKKQFKYITHIYVKI